MTDEEKKMNELMNRISFALKDATLQQDFELIRKRISVLESDLKVARNDRKYLEMEVGRGLREYIKDCPYSALNNFADAKIFDENEQLKKNALVWHDLRKNPDDLPKEHGEYITNIGLLYYDRLCDRDFWHTPSCEACDYSDEVGADEVIAWCELPKFEE